VLVFGVGLRIGNGRRRVKKVVLRFSRLRRSAAVQSQLVRLLTISSLVVSRGWGEIEMDKCGPKWCACEPWLAAR
jgi:hypothetical protein